jgi:hypothetical protein
VNFTQFIFTDILRAIQKPNGRIFIRPLIRNALRPFVKSCAARPHGRASPYAGFLAAFLRFFFFVDMALSLLFEPLILWQRSGSPIPHHGKAHNASKCDPQIDIHKIMMENPLFNRCSQSS